MGIAFKPIAGIRVARNQLIEHPEKKPGGLLAGGIEVRTGPFDVRLKVPNTKPAMDGHERVVDAAIFGPLPTS